MYLRLLPCITEWVAERMIILECKLPLKCYTVELNSASNFEYVFLEQEQTYKRYISKSEVLLLPKIEIKKIEKLVE